MTCDDHIIGRIVGGGIRKEDGAAGNGNCGTGTVRAEDGVAGASILVVDLTDDGKCQDGTGGAGAEGHQSQSVEGQPVAFIKTASEERIIEETVARLVKGFQQENVNTLEENKRLKEQNLQLEDMLKKVVLELAMEIAKAKILEDKCNEMKGVIGDLTAAVCQFGLSVNAPLTIGSTAEGSENLQGACEQVPMSPQKEATPQHTPTMASTLDSDVVGNCDIIAEPEIVDVEEESELCNFSRYLETDGKQFKIANSTFVLSQHVSHQQLDTHSEEDVAEEEVVLQGSPGCEVPVGNENCIPTDPLEASNVIFVSDNVERQLDFNGLIKLVAAGNVAVTVEMPETDADAQQMDSDISDRGDSPPPSASSYKGDEDTLWEELLAPSVTVAPAFPNYRNGRGPYISSMNVGENFRGYRTEPYRRSALQTQSLEIEHASIGTSAGVENICSCGKISRDRRALEKHIRYYSKYRCGVCGKRHPSVESMEIHMVEDHGMQAPSS